MPTYEYRCKDCGHDLEAQQAFTDEPLTECPACGGTLKKRFGSVGISFKGSGFYKNDARGSSSASSTTDATSTPAKETSAPSSDSGSTTTGAPATPSTPSGPPSGGGSSSSSAA